MTRIEALKKYLISPDTIPMFQRSICPKQGDTDIIGPVELAKNTKAVYFRLNGVNHLKATVTPNGELYTWPYSNEIMDIPYNTTSDELTQAIELAKLEL